ncbi:MULTISPECIES: OmpH family outer membrane protein [Sphingomonas]|uniref:OmpH family outer membrane protein n=1 Tax=Sphingomonas TaxID=13687 RepID=UPI0008324A8C|nr:OmpH family outer membrane protein [Sphingomonas sp. CCH10-B3]
MKTKFTKAVITAAFAVGVLALPQAAFAQATLVVDVDQLYKDSVAAKSGSAQLEAKYGARLRDLQTKLEAAVKAWNEQVEAAKKVAKPDGTVPDATRDALQKAQNDLNQAKGAFDDARQEIQYLSQYVQAQIVEKLLPIAESIRKARKGDSVVPRNSLLAFDPANDITATALQQLNATLTSVSITPPQQNQQAPAAGGTAPAKPATTPAKPQPQSR